MNLHQIVSSAISAVNPFQDITLIQSSGYVVDEYGDSEPMNCLKIQLKADVQPISSEDIKYINNYNESTIYRKFWVNGSVHSLNRPLHKGGDIIIWNGQKYKTQSVPEDWQTVGWTCFIGVLQL